MDALNIFKASGHYSNLLDSFSCDEKLNVDYSKVEVSKAIYFHICKMKYAGWRHRINFKRKRKHSISEFFQDIIAFYLKVSLPDEFEIELETKIGKTQPDIAIRKKGKYHFIIEIKTNIGWDRPDLSQIDPYLNMRQRVSELANNFQVSPDNVIYVFEDHANVTREFSEKFWDMTKQASVARSTEFPFSIIYPLFNATDPYYWRHDKGFNRNKNYKPISDDLILSMAENNIVTPFESILNKIKTAGNMGFAAMLADE
jgi:hypothetical protein